MHSISTTDVPRGQSGTKGTSIRREQRAFSSAFSAVQIVRILFSCEDLFSGKSKPRRRSVSAAALSHYADGITSCSPGLARHELPWEREIKCGYPERVGSKNECRRAIFNRGRAACPSRLMQLLQSWNRLHARPKVARSSQPWAIGCNPFGIVFRAAPLRFTSFWLRLSRAAPLRCQLH